MEWIKYATVAVGAVSAAGSLGLATYFYRSPKRVGRSVAHMYLAESWAMTMTVAFSVGEGIYLDMLPLWLMTAMRLSMFLAAIGSSVHMAYSLDKILRGQDD